MADLTSDEAYALYTKGRVDAAKAATALLDFSGPGGSATQASIDKANALQNQAGAAALANIGYSVGSNGEMVKTGSPSASYTAAQTTSTPAAAADATGGAATAAPKVVGYSGLANAVPANGMDLRTLVEKTTGHTLDYGVPGEAEVVNRAIMALNGNVGANLDARNWNAIMASSNPLDAAEKALKAMYSDKAYLAANADYVLAKGYLPEQADFTYKQMPDRVGSTYNPEWSKGTKFEGKYDTAAYLNNLNTLKGSALDAYNSSVWSKWGGDPRLNASKGVVATDPTKNTVFTPPTTPGQITGTSTFTPGQITGTITFTPGSTGTPGNTGIVAAATTGGLPTKAATTTTQTPPVQLNTPTASGGAGLLTGANNLAPGTFTTPNTSTGNVNSGGLISGATQQMFTQNAQVGLPTGVAPKLGMMGNSTNGPSITPYNPYNFTGSTAGTGAQQNWYNAKTGQRYTAPAGSWTPPSADWTAA